MKKVIVLLLDGLGDRAFAQLNHKTPLDFAHTPTLDAIAAAGANGLFHASHIGEPLPSELAHLIMFGYSRSDYPGRGPLEALGYDIEIAPGDVAWLSRIVEIEPDATGYKVINRWPELTPQQVKELVAQVNAYAPRQFTFTSTSRTFGVLTLRGPASAAVTDTDPIIQGRYLYQAVPRQDAARSTAEAVNEFSRWSAETLKLGTSRYAVALQRSGALQPVSSFYQTNGLRGCSISSGAIYRGLCRYLRMEHRQVQDTTDCGADYAQRIQLALDSLDDFDFIHVHTKIPDKAAHAKDPMAKVYGIEALDRGIAALWPQLQSTPELLLAVAADHSTPSDGPLLHSGEPVPVIFHGAGCRRDNVTRYAEIAAPAGSLGCLRDKEWMASILNAIDRSRLAGFHETTPTPHYWPADGVPLK